MPAYKSFIGSRQESTNPNVTLFGVPFDGTASFMSGARDAPAAIRRVSEVLETYSPELEKDVTDIDFFDDGDIEIPIGNVNKSLENIEKKLNHFPSTKPLLIGGEHLITLPALKALNKVQKDLVIVQFDAHADLRDEYLGEKLSHATVMKRIADLLGPDSIYQVGVRSGTKDEFEYGYKNTNFHPGSFDRALMYKIVDDIGLRPVYISVDIDILDPSFAPATGTPEPGGWSFEHLSNALYILAKKNIVGCDIVEVCPPAEQGMITTILSAAKLIREMIIAFSD